MATPLDIPRVPDPLAGLRAATEAHAAAVDASRQAGAAVQAEKQQPPAAIERQP